MAGPPLPLEVEMKRTLLYVLAVGLGVGLAFLLLRPGEEGADAGGAVGRGRVVTPDEDPVQQVTKTARPVDDGAAAPAASEEAPAPQAAPAPEPVPVVDKERAQEALEARKATPYYKYMAKVGKYWVRVSQLLEAEGEDEAADKARALFDELREATRTRDLSQTPQDLVERQEAMLAELRGLGGSDELTATLDYIEQALQALKAGQEPPPPDSSRIHWGTP